MKLPPAAGRDRPCRDRARRGAIALVGRSRERARRRRPRRPRRRLQLVGTIGAPVEHGPRRLRRGARRRHHDRVDLDHARGRARPALAVTGRLRTPRGLLDPGAPDRAAQLASRGASWEMTARTSSSSGLDRGMRDRDVALGRPRRKRAGRDRRCRRRSARPGGAALRGYRHRRSRRRPRCARSALARVGIYHVLSVQRPAPRGRRRARVRAAAPLIAADRRGAAASGLRGGRRRRRSCSRSRTR